MEKNISVIALGIRHRRSFRIPEIAGQIIDVIAHDERSPFNKSIFNQTDAIVDGIENKGRILVGKDGVSSLAIDTDSVVLTLKSSAITTTRQDLEQKFIPYLATHVFTQFNIANINRLGIVYEFQLNSGKIARTVISGATAGIFTNPEQMQLRFAAKALDVKSLVKKGLLDYSNKIVSLTALDNKTVAKFDYQFYYQPEIKRIDDVDFRQFLDIADSKLKAEFCTWLDVNYEKDPES